MTNEERNKIIKAIILAGVTASGIGVYTKYRKSKKEQNKRVEDDKNTIIVPIKKSKFLEGIPTPNELEESRGITMLEAPSLTNDSIEPTLSAEDIDWKKKEILRNNGKKFNFFGKAAEHDSTKNESPDKQKENDGEDDEHNEDDNLTEDKENDGLSKNNERKYYRNQDGEFVSPTDPTAVEESEKNAEGIVDLFVSPIQSVKRVFGSAADRPVWYTAGALGSIYLAAKISDTINEHRRKKAQENLEQSRDEYVNLIQQGEEKVAADVRDVAGVVLGSSFVVPMALTALLTTKVIENRKKEKKQAKESKSSFPDEPIILYKTSEAKEIKTTPEAMLASIIFKRDMLMSEERHGDVCGMKKLAYLGGAFPKLQNRPEGVSDEDLEKNYRRVRVGPLGLGKTYVPKSMPDWYDKYIERYHDAYEQKPMSDDEAFDTMYGMFTADNNDADSLAVVKGIKDGGDVGTYFNNLNNMANKLPEEQRNRFYGYLQSKNRRDALKRKFMTSQRAQDFLVDRFTNSKYQNTYGAYGQSLVSNELGKQFREGTILHKIMMWIYNTFGIGKNKLISKINDQFAQARRTAEENPFPWSAGEKPVGNPLEADLFRYAKA